MHPIRRGDTLSQLAQRYNTSVETLAQQNGIADPDLIYAGDTLEIPGSRDTFEPAAEANAGATGAAAAAAAGARSAPPGDVKGGITQQELTSIMPNLPASKAAEYLPHLNKAMIEGGINTPERQSAFLAQLAHESGGLQYMEEIASGAAYEGRTDLGNTQPGDGVRFKGRGPIQLTGRANYEAAGEALGIDLVNNPERAADPDVAFRVAAWYWNSRDLSSYADRGDFNSITYRINGGYNGASERVAYWERAKAALA